LLPIVHLPALSLSAQTIEEDSYDHHFSFDNNMKKLKDISSSLRGPNKNPTSIIMQLKSMAASFSATLGSIQDQYLSGEKEKAGATLKAAVGDIKSLVDTSKETKQIISGVDNLPQALKNDNALNEFDSDSLQDMPDSAFEDLIESQAFNDLTDLSRYVNICCLCLKMILLVLLTRSCYIA
jgi:hypothetical protein